MGCLSYLPLLSTWLVFFLLLSMGTPCISTHTWGSTMEVGLSHSGLGSCWAEITWNKNIIGHYWIEQEFCLTVLTLIYTEETFPAQLDICTSFATCFLPEQWAGQDFDQDLHQRSLGWRWCQAGTWKEASGRTHIDHSAGTCHDSSPSAHQVSGSLKQLEKTQHDWC